MSLYTIGFVLVIAKLIQVLLEALFSKEVHSWVSMMFTVLFGVGSIMAVTELVRCQIPLWITIPIGTVVAIGIVLLFKMEINESKEDK